MTEPGLVLAFFLDHDAAAKAVRRLRRNGFYGIALVYKSPEGRIRVEQRETPEGQAALWGGLAGFALTAAFPALRVARAVPSLVGAMTGYGLARAFDQAVREGVIERYQSTLVKGESVVIVEAPITRLSRALAVLREGDAARPTTFVSRVSHLKERDEPTTVVASREPATIERLAERARELARRHQPRKNRTYNPVLLRRLRENARVIEAVHDNLVEAARLDQPVSLSAEWLLDNSYIIQGQILEVKRSLSHAFYRELPVVESLPVTSTKESTGEGASAPPILLPRVYAIARELIAHTDNRLDRAHITAFVMAYQETAPLSIAELWALPLMLRLALIENLRRLFAATDRRQRDRERADFWANRLLNAARREPDRVLPFLSALAEEQSDARPHFADRLVSLLYDEGGVLTHVRSWLERKLDAPFAEIVAREQRRQASDQISVSNAISSQRLLNQLDWSEVFEELSIVERELRQDPAGVYARMDFATRDVYRRQVERLARQSPFSEREVAAQVVALARGVEGQEEEKRSEGEEELISDSSSLLLPLSSSLWEHVGYHLIDAGQRAFEDQVGYSPPLSLRARRVLLDHPLPIYLGAIGAITWGAANALAFVAHRAGGRFPGGAALLALLPASEIGSQFVNYLVTRLVPPRPLPKMDFEKGVPDQCSTLVVVPMMLDSLQSIRENVENLEVHYLANTDARLKFALLADFTDADSERKANDDELLKAAKDGIEKLNTAYRAPRFFLFHRERRWSDSENRWMGWERKRGKLEQLNAWLCGEGGQSADELHPVAGDWSTLGDIRFVLTLDADAQLPHDTARKLIETLAHPLNRPVVGSRLSVVGKNDDLHEPITNNQQPTTDYRQPTTNNRQLPLRGYTVVMPRVATSLPSATATRFSRLFTEVSGTDPYTHVVSDVYQDVFGESSYQGKGIYDVEVFHRVLDRRFPASHILSHDLLEGAHVRVGLASDIEILDQFPPNYETYARREHRWIRGDWQIADWVGNFVPTAKGIEPNPLSLLNRWKIADNLRRSLVAPATVALLLRGWSGNRGLSVAASTLAGVCRLSPAILQLLHFLTSGPKTVSGLRDLAHTFERAVISTAFLPHQAQLALDAITRVLYRRGVSRKLLLEWQTASASYRSARERERGFILKLAGSSAFAASVGVLLSRRPFALRVASPFLVLWASAPLLAKWLSTHTRREIAGDVTPDDRRFLRRVARRTWRYFDDFVGPQTNWLPPDNYQETLNVEIAQRTSPTNIGLWLQATLAAYDFGYLPGDDAISRALPTLRTFDEMEKYNGHLLNWYNVQTLEPLRPRYVSTVDSGNMLGSLVTLLRGGEEMVSEPFLDGKALRGLSDTLAALCEVLPSGSPAIPAMHRLEELLSYEGDEPVEIGRRLRAAMPVSEQLLLDIAADVGRKAKADGESTSGQTALDLQQAIFDPRFTVSESVYWAAQVEQTLSAWILVCDRYGQWLDMLSDQPEAWFEPLGEDALARRRELLERAPSLSQLASGDVRPFHDLLAMRSRRGLSPELLAWLGQVEEEFGRSRWLAGEMVADAEELLDRTRKTIDETDLKFLFNDERKLFPVGFSVEEMRADSSFYDLLASECRLASFLAIARGQVPAEHWWNLGRRYGRGEDNAPVLLSWSGTMFEYLMPTLFTRGHEQSLLDMACRDAVQNQILYARRQNIPWGISEAAFSDLDANRVYQYKAFGVPTLGLQRGHDNDLVVAPYATLMALGILPREALSNLKNLQELGAYGAYGFYESVDFSRQRLEDDGENEVAGENGQANGQGKEAKNGSRDGKRNGKRDGKRSRSGGERGVIVRAFMVHHQGMALLALDNLLNRKRDEDGELGVMQARFHEDPYVRAATPLLHEGIPLAPAVLDNIGDETPPERLALPASATATEFSRVHAPDSLVPRPHLLSNGNYSIMVTNVGGGYSRWRDYSISRWRADTTSDDRGTFLYIRDLESSATWSVAHQPLRRAARAAWVEFKPERVEFKRRDAEIETITDVFVAPEDDCEIRRLTLVNHSTRPRAVEVTSYVELALNAHAADRAHPAFSKLFIQTEAIADRDALLAFRRPRSEKDEPVWAMHLVAGNGYWEMGNGNQANSQLPTPNSQYETDRAKFIGRGRSTADPQSLSTPLSNTAGAVLDPIFSLRRRVFIGPGQRVQISFVTGAGESREAMMHLVEKYSDPLASDRALELAWTHAQLEMHHLRVRPDETQLFQQLASGVLYPHLAFRAPGARLRENVLGQSVLWSYGISGDLPIFVVVVDHERDLPAVRQALMAHTFWRLHGLKSDLVILNQQAGGYQQELTEKLKNLAGAFVQYVKLDAPGGIFIRARENMPDAHLTLIMAAAHIVMVASRGRLAQQLSTLPGPHPQAPRLIIAHRPPEEPSRPLPFLQLPYFNGLGGFTPDGREYAVYLSPRIHTPAPWINVMSNPVFGQMVSEAGHGFAWWGNSQANRMTDWSNDPVSDPINDAIYIRDDDTGLYWTPTALPIREEDAYRARHGQGYTIYEHNSHAIEQELVSFVPLFEDEEQRSGGEDEQQSTPLLPFASSPPLRLQRLRLRNASSRRRRLTITGYHEWVLGTDKEQTQLHVVTSWDTESHTLLAHNTYHPDYGSRVAFSTSSPAPTHFTADRTAFLGRNGRLSSPAVLRRKHLTDRAGAGLDPCAATQLRLELAPGETAEITFLMGQGGDVEEVRELVARFRDPLEVESALQATRRAWDEVLGTLEVQTPILSINFLLNRWLLYQNLSCRFWGRSAFYQSGGAWGFRDQLQDVMALVYSLPDIVRAQILRAAAHQFEEGDVQHWWHEPSGAGVRTRITDDLLFLPYVVAHYVAVTGDESVLDEEVPFLHAPELTEDEHEKYFKPQISPEKASIYEHCVRALERGSTAGPHGLPLIGTGDWNDGLNLVGEEGRGESVWLAWFLIDTTRKFADLIAERDKAYAKKLRTRATRYAKAVEQHAWDGAWYRRAYYDDGAPLGSHESDEAKIDVLPQAWAAISHAGDEQRTTQALESVDEYLVKRDDKMVLLFTPPFDKTQHNPGYIKGYLPGVRENGGQYTHGALWLTLAHAMRGDGDKAVEILQLLNPVEHARDRTEAARYKVEPYVVAADVYALEGQVGRGGWTWYTGSAGWMYRVWVEAILGFQPRGDKLFINPAIPPSWKEYSLRYRYGVSRYEIKIENPDGVMSGVREIECDGQKLKQKWIPLQDDGELHRVIVRLGIVRSGEDSKPKTE